MSTAPAPPPSELQLALAQWRQSSPAPLLLDLRSASAHAARRLVPSACVHWRQLESAWFTLPAYGVDFAVLLPDAADEERADAEWRSKQEQQQQHSASSHAAALPPSANDEESIDEDAPAAATAAAAAAAGASSSSSSSAALGVKARVKSGPPPLSPSSPAFRFSRASILHLLRFYGWRVPDAWAWTEGSELWSAAQAAGVPVHDHRHPVTQQLLFSPAPALQMHFDEICLSLQKQRQQDAAAAAAADAAPGSPSPHPKQARAADAACVSSAAAAAASTAAASASTASRPLMCLDVACGSGRDLCWLLWHAEQKRQQQRQQQRCSGSLDPRDEVPAWSGVGVDCASGALCRAAQLAAQLGVADRVQLRRARINQQTGQWHVSKSDGGSDAAAAVTVEPEPAPAVAAEVAAVAAPSSLAPASASAAASASASAAASTAASAASTGVPPSAPSCKAGQQQRRDKRKKKEAMRAAAAAEAAAAAATLSAPAIAAEATASSSSSSSSSSSLSSSSSSSSSCALPLSVLLSPCSFDLIVCVRFLCRSFVRLHVSRLLRPGGFFLLSTFIDDGVTLFAQPANPQFRIAGLDELRRMANDAGLDIIHNRIGRTEDGRPISQCVMRKPSK